MKTVPISQAVYFSFYPEDCDGCPDYSGCFERLGQGLEGYAPSYAVAARTCNAYLKALREADPHVDPLVYSYLLKVEPRDLGGEL